MSLIQEVSTPAQQNVTDEIEKKLFAKIAWRFLPILMISYVFNYIDRTSISVAALTMNEDIGLTSSQFGYGAGILFLGYCLFEVPSNLILYRVGARLWISRIMISWGLVSSAMVFASGPMSFYILRFMLGVAEAGFFPGVAYYLSCWFPSKYRAQIIGWFLIAIPASSFIGAPVSALLLNLDGVLGLAGWKWMFLIESLPCVVLGFVVAKLLADSPGKASWLKPHERELVVRLVANEQRVKPATNMRSVLSDIRVWILSGIYLGFSIGSYGVQVWLPQIIKQENFSNVAVGFLTAIPYLCAVVVMIAWAAYVDKNGRRIKNVMLTCVIAGLGFFVSFLTQSFVFSLVGLTIALVGVNAARAVFWAIPSRYLVGVAAAGGLALINSIGTLGGFLGPWIMGWLKEETGNFTAGLAVMAACLFIAGLLALILQKIASED
ncbi:membrane protein [Pseudomonas paralactis]|uniref:Membrane protein n=1 Tax=Pseudomonas paralactis TaxID=1615673 RepID=A0A0R3ANJ3_9PSED|nr:MFS transporter [Pseudomonas paralactis]KRP74821.1 membrane protein [Pseudomonas paralactis]